MSLYIFQNQQALAAALILPLILLMLPFRVLAQAGVSTYSVSEEPSVKLGPWAGDLKVGPGMNAVGKRLKGSQFVGQDLQGSVFDGCDLDGMEFYRCDLSNASFKGAHMTGMLFGRSKIDGADFTDATIKGIRRSPPEPGSGLARIHMSHQQLVSTRSYKTKDLSECVIYGFNENISEPPRYYDFRGATLFKAVLNGDFRECDFTDASIMKARLGKCTITADQLASTIEFKRRRLYGASLDGDRIKGKLDLSGMELPEIRLSGSFADVSFDDANIRRGTFEIAKQHLLATRNYREGDLSSMRFISVDLLGFDFSAVNLTSCYFGGDCDFTAANFDDAVITNVWFSEDNSGLTVEQIKSTWNYKHGRMDGITLPEHIAKALQQEEQADK